MKVRTILMAVMALTMAASTRVAQAQDQMVVKVPFDFAAGNAQLPAGEYSVKASEATRMLFLINRANPEISLIIPANAAQANQIQTESKLVFNRYGERYFLSQVWLEGTSRGRQLVKSMREKEMATVAKIGTQGQVTLTASLSPTTR